MIALITINYNDFESTSKFIEAIRDYIYLDRIIVVDNHSSDGSYEKLLEFANDRIHVVHSEENRGYAFGNNIGIRYAISKWNIDYFVISNPDVFFTENTLKNIVNEMKHDSSIAICSAVMRDGNNRVFTNFSAKLPRYTDLLMGCFQGIVQFRTKVLHHSEYDRFDDIKGKKVFYSEVVPGSFFIADRHKFEEIGFFDESTFLYFEENIAAYKLKQFGYKEAILPKESYNHYHSVSINKNIKKQATKSKIMLKSAIEYMKIIGINDFGMLFYRFAFWLGFPERLFFSWISRQIRG